MVTVTYDSGSCFFSSLGTKKEVSFSQQLCQKQLSASLSLTPSRHLHTVGLLARLADPRGVVRPDAEPVLSLRFQARADVERCVFTSAYFSPASSLDGDFSADLYNVSQDSRASVVAGAGPGENQGLGRQPGNNRLGGGGNGSVWEEKNVEILLLPV